MTRPAAGSLRAALVPWLVARAVVLGSLELARYLVSHLHPPRAVVTRAHEGLLGWDAGYYRDIAEKGYAALHPTALRFFPLVPLATRGLHDMTRLSYDASLLVVANACALGATALLHRLALEETGDAGVARAAAWVISLASSAFVLVMGYSEALLILLGVATFMLMRTGRWWGAAGTAFLAGLTRPVGLLLALPLAIEAVGLSRLGAGRHWPRSASGRARRGVTARLTAVVAPVVGCVAYLAWVGHRFGDFWAPFSVQVRGNLRGRFADPVTTAAHDLRGLAHGHLGTGLHVPWLAVFVALGVVLLARWPLPYGAYAFVTLALAVSSSNFDSLERYALSAFPLTLAAAGLLRSESRLRVALPFLGAMLVSYSLLAFLNALVP